MRAKEGIDGKQQKKRGPKTDSKPALNSKQEKNRQAQRYLMLLPYWSCDFLRGRCFFGCRQDFLSKTQATSNKSYDQFDVSSLSLMLTVHPETTVRESLRTP